MKIKKSEIKKLNADCDFFYDLTDGGYIDPMKLLDSKDDAKKVIEATKIVKEFQDVYFDSCPEGA